MTTRRCPPYELARDPRTQRLTWSACHPPGDGYADHGCVLLLTNDRGYWRPAAQAGTIDAEFRLHEGRVLEGALRWADRASPGTTAGRDSPLSLTGRYACRWRDYSQVSLDSGRTAIFRYLLINVGRGQTDSPALQDAGPETQPAPPAPALPSAASTRHPAGSAREEILAAARKLAGRSPDRSFTLMEIIAETRRSGSRYAESTIRTHVTSRMCADSPDHHGTTYDDLERLGRGRYRLRTASQSRTET